MARSRQQQRRIPSNNPQIARRRPPSLEALSQYNVNRPGQIEAVYQPLYDYQLYAAAGQTSLTFFQVPVGGGAVPRTLADTNMRSAGQLPAPQQFLIQSIQVQLLPGFALTSAAAIAATSFAQDAYTILANGILRLRVGSKDYVEHSPLIDFPPTSRMSGFAAASTGTGDATTFKATYAQADGVPFAVVPIRLIASQNFSVTLEWPAAVAVPSANATTRIGVKFTGYMYRNSQ